MDTLQQLKSELQQEYDTTKKFFELYPAEKANYTPHTKSMSLQQLATHIAEIFGWPAIMLNTEMLDFAKWDYKPTVINSREELMSALDKNYQAGKNALEKAKDSDLELKWSMANNGQTLAEWSKYGAIRHSLNQITHHRAQLGVYYRLLEIPIPTSYGPTADHSEM